ncbi:hypothetical protein PMAYCL1PPCAC_26034, partial [Pristionchus mayeri]
IQSITFQMTMVDQTQSVTFFNYSKQIPKGVKRHCGLCRQHGVMTETRNHACPFKQCECAKCHLVSHRRAIMSTQIMLRREQDKKFVRTAEPGQAEVVPPTATANARYFCQKCKNHGVLSWKKDHKKKCDFAECNCHQCVLIDSRRALDLQFKNSRKRSHVDEESVMEAEFDGEAEVSSITSSPSASNVQTPSLCGVDVSQSLGALGFSATPEVNQSSATPLLPALPNDSSSQFLSNELLLQTLAQQVALLSAPQVPVSPVPIAPHVSTPPAPYITFTLPAPSNGASLTVLYHNPVDNQIHPTITNSNPVLPLPQFPFSAPPSTNPLPPLTEMDIHNLVGTILRGTRM